MDSTCVVCHDRVAQFRCLQCHKPVCDECAFKTDMGAFCGRNCAAQYRDYRKDGGAVTKEKKGSLIKTLILLIILAAGVFAVAYWRGWLPESVQEKVEEVRSKAAEQVEQGR